MMKRKGTRRQKLKILVSFEPSRLGRAAMEEAYERLAPSHGRPPKVPVGLDLVAATLSGQGE
jgi:hypothetical protein